MSSCKAFTTTTTPCTDSPLGFTGVSCKIWFFMKINLVLRDGLELKSWTGCSYWCWCGTPLQAAVSNEPLIQASHFRLSRYSAGALQTHFRIRPIFAVPVAGKCANVNQNSTFRAFLSVRLLSVCIQMLWYVFDWKQTCCVLCICAAKTWTKLECGPMPNLMVALPNIGGVLCSTPQSLADAHY